MMIEGLELSLAIVGCVILWRATITERFRGFASSIFLLCYVPLFCVYPVIARWLVGGAISIKRGTSDTFQDPHVYIIYLGYNAFILAGCLLLSAMPLAPDRKSVV